MAENFITAFAMALDTLPPEGRVLLMACLLTVSLYGLGRLMPVESNLGMQIVYRKGVFATLLLVPVGVYLFGLQMPVYVAEFVYFESRIPAYIAYAVLAVWVTGAGISLYRIVVSVQETHTSSDLDAAPESIQKRCEHWCRRLNLKRDVRVVCGGSEQGWHILHGRQAVIVLPAAAIHWPTGVLDVMLLHQLALIQQQAWKWLLFGSIVRALYWPLPWMSRMLEEFADCLVIPATRLAEAAYRDPEGWRRDLRKFLDRGDTLKHVEFAPSVIRLPSQVETEQVHVVDDAVDESFEARWAGSKARLRRKYRDPYRQAYWLIAAASVLIAVSMTVTVVKAPPEFEPTYLNIKWRDQMVRRLKDHYDGGEEAGQETDSPAANTE